MNRVIFIHTFVYYLKNGICMEGYNDDRYLLDALKRDDEGAFEYLFKTYYPRLYGYAVRFTEDDEITRDIIQESFIKVWEKRQLLTAVSLSSLLFTMVRNACLNHLKHRAIVGRYQMTYLANVRGEERLYHIDFQFDSDKELLYEEMQQQIGTVMAGLPERSREIFAMSRFEGLKNREIAEKLGISTTAVEKHISKAIRRFSEHFREIYPHDIYIMVLGWVIALYL